MYTIEDVTVHTFFFVVIKHLIYLTRLKLGYL